jgi:hypothetical protein
MSGLYIILNNRTDKPDKGFNIQNQFQWCATMMVDGWWMDGGWWNSSSCAMYAKGSAGENHVSCGGDSPIGAPQRRWWMVDGRWWMVKFTDGGWWMVGFDGGWWMVMVDGYGGPCHHAT